jgi:hypothetical protein
MPAQWQLQRSAAGSSVCSWWARLSVAAAAWQHSRVLRDAGTVATAVFSSRLQRMHCTAPGWRTCQRQQ